MPGRVYLPTSLRTTQCASFLQAKSSLANLRNAVDTLIVIPNDRLLTGALLHALTAC